MNICQESINAVALTLVGRYSPAVILQLYQKMGSATTIVENHRDIRNILPEASPRIVELLDNIQDFIGRAEEELAFDEKHNILPLVFNDKDYPERLRHCEDAPLVLFYRGTADINQRRILSIVGTRHCTAYGQDNIKRFISELHDICPNVLIVSGLAYGVDINAHRQALANGYETVGVLAHGLDYLYPTSHRDTAKEMLNQGGLVTEFSTRTNADKLNFVRRNRIVAGMADATLLVESASHGGGLITIDIANDYGRDVFAFPGNLGAQYSEGCNNAIRDNKARLLTSAEDFAQFMGWDEDRVLNQARKKGIERQLFPSLSAEEECIVNILKNTNNLNINIIATKANKPIGMISSILFNLELKGIVKLFAGNTYHLIE